MHREAKADAGNRHWDKIAAGVEITAKEQNKQKRKEKSRKKKETKKQRTFELKQQKKRKA